jgi:uncharacterized protein YggL (DUF469 family)
MFNDSRHRSRRLRKKLHVGEYQVLGFSLAISARDSLTADQWNDLWDRFMAEAIESQRLSCGGLTDTYVTPEGDVSATESNRTHVKQWLIDQPEVIDFTVGELSNAYGTRGPLFLIPKTRAMSARRPPGFE